VVVDMAVRNFLNPFGAYIDGAMRGQQFALKEVSDQQNVRDTEDNYIGRMLRRPDELAVLSNAAQLGTSRNFLMDQTMGDQISTSRNMAISTELERMLNQYSQPLKQQQEKSRTQQLQTEADFGVINLPDRVRAGQLGNQSTQSTINNRDVTTQRAQADLENDQRVFDVQQETVKVFQSLRSDGLGKFFVTLDGNSVEISAAEAQELQ